MQSSFEFRGETINVDWHDATNVNDLPHVKWEQVYAIGDVDGKVPVVCYADTISHAKPHNLPGGKFDEPGDTIERVLEREMCEELNMRVLSWRPIGYQYLQNEKFGNAYQLRVYTKLEKIGEFENDPGGSVVGYLLIDIEQLNDYIQYGDVGERMIESIRHEFAKNT